MTVNVNSGHRSYARGGTILPNGDVKKYKSVTQYISVIPDGWFFSRRDLAFAMRGLLNADSQELKRAHALFNKDLELAKLGDDLAKKEGKWAAADAGSRLHKITEEFDYGRLSLSDPRLSDDERASLRAYAIATAPFTWTHIEQKVVNDLFEYVGTADRFGRYQAEPTQPLDVVVDIKSSKTLDLGYLSLAMQLAAYANGDLYNGGAERKPNKVSKKIGYVIWLPATQPGVCKVYPVDIAEGLKGLEAALEVYTQRSKGKRVYVSPDEFTQGVQYSVWEARIQKATTRDQLVDIFTVASARGEWTEDMTKLAQARTAVLHSN